MTNTPHHFVTGMAEVSDGCHVVRNCKVSCKSAKKCEVVPVFIGLSST